MSLYWVLTSVVGVVFLGLVAYPMVKSRRSGGTIKPRVEGSGGRLGATEDMVDVESVEDFALRVQGGDLVAMLEVHPLVVTTGMSPDAMGEMFAQVIHHMPDGETWQIVQIPGTQSIEAYTDRLARLGHAWVAIVEEAQGGEAELSSDEGTFRCRLSLPATLGALILERAATADLALRRTFIVLTHPARNIGKGPSGEKRAAGQRVPGESLEAFRRRIFDATTAFETAGFSVRQASPHEMLEALWHAYNPGALSDGGVREQRQRRFAEILDSGVPTTPYTATITDDEIERAVGEAAEDGLALRRLLAPRSWEERDDQIVINDAIAASTYFVDNFSYDLMPSLSRILGEYAGRLHVAMYVRAPERAEVVERARKATVARQASEMVRGAYGQIQNYKAAQEITATEDLRARAEMGLETPRFLGMYLMLFGRGSEELEKLVPRFESHLRNQGVRYVLARWQQEAAFRSALPLGQRRHRYSDRNLTPENFAALCPSAGATYFEPHGYHHAFLRPDGEAMAPEAPLVLDRLRGGNAPGASEALIGSPRSGKSVTLKTLALTWLAHNHRVIVIDPKGEYRPLAEWAGGQVTTLSGAGGSGFNLFHFERLEAGEVRSADLAASTFSGNLDALLTLYAFLKDSRRPFVTGPERSLLTRALKSPWSGRACTPRIPRHGPRLSCSWRMSSPSSVRNCGRRTPPRPA